MTEILQENVLKIWLDGGWLMIPLALLGGFIYITIFQILVYLHKHRYAQANPDEWGHWIERIDEAEGDLGGLIRYAQLDANSMSEVRRRMQEIRQAHLPRVDDRIRLATILVGTAPLTGLLGTVTGMLTTFSGLAVSSGGNTIDLVAGGISEALITTQTGLVLAIPGYVLLNIAHQKRDELNMLFNQIEILTLQFVERKFNLKDAV